MTSYLEKLKSLLGDMYYPLATGTRIVFIIAISIIIVKVGSFIIRKFFEKQKSFKHGLDGRRLNTMATLLASVFRYTVYIIAVVMILSDVLQLKSILAAAGIGGIALGFGAQSLIKDMISGFFIVFEDQYIVGDMVTIDTMSGTVEELELRVTKLRNANGDLHIIPNGEVKKVTNHSRGNKAVTVDIPLAYSNDMGKAVEIAGEVCKKVSAEFETIVEPPSVLGITELGKENITLRVTAKTLPNEHWAVERRIRRLVKDEFDKNGVKFINVLGIPDSGSLSKGGGKNG